MARWCVLDYTRHRHLKRIRAVRLDAKVHTSLAAGRVLIYGLVVDEDTQRKIASLRLPDNLEIDPALCSLRMTPNRLYLMYRTTSAAKAREVGEWMKEQMATLDADRFEVSTLAKWEAPQHVASSPLPTPTVEKIEPQVGKNLRLSPGSDTAPTVPAVTQPLARAVPSSSRMVRPATLTSSGLVRLPMPPVQRPTLPPAQTLRPAATPLPPTQESTETVRDAVAPHPPPPQRGTYVQSSPAPELTQASEPIAAAPSATAVAGANVTATPLAITAPATTTQAMPAQATTTAATTTAATTTAAATTAATTTAAATTAATTPAATTTPTTTALAAPLMMTIGKLTAERLHAWDDESTQLPYDVVPSAHYVVDAMGRRGVKSHNFVLSQWGHVSVEGQGKKVAWNAFAIVDGFGQKASPVHAAKDLVENVMTEMRQAGQVVSTPEGASSDEVAYALQDSFTKALPQAMTAGFEASSRQMKADSKHGQQGSMVTLALVCGRHLTVATAGTSLAHLDTGSDIVMMSRLLNPEDGKPGPGIPIPTIRQVVIPAHGARLLMGSKAFWKAIPFKQSVKNMRAKSAREVPTALQMVAIKGGAQLHPTILVADLLPVGCGVTQLEFQHMREQQAEVQVWRPMEPATHNNPHPDWHAMLMQRRSSNAPTCEALTPQASEHPAGAHTHSLPTDDIPSVPTSTAAAAAVSDSDDKPEAEVSNDSQAVPEQTMSGDSAITKAAKKRAGKSRAQERRAASGEQVLKQQEQLAALARQNRKPLPNSTTTMATDTAHDMHSDSTPERLTDRPADSTKQGTNSVADQAVFEESISSQPGQQPSAASQPQGLGRQGRGRSRTQDSRAHSRLHTGPGRSRGRGTQGHSGTCTKSQGHQTPSGRTQDRSQALRQAQAAAATALSRPMPTERMTLDSPTSCQNAALQRDDMGNGSADTIRHQGPEQTLPGHDTTRLAQAAHRSRAGQQLRSSTTREHHHQQQQQPQQQHRQARTTQALAGRQAGVAANHFNAVMPPTSTSEGGKIRHAAADCHMRSTRIDGYMICEVRRPCRA